MQSKFSYGANSIPPAPTFLALASDPKIISFAGGVPDPVTFPISQISQATERLLGTKEKAIQAFQYAPSHGYEPLRSWIAETMRLEDINVEKSQILITSGAQQALDILGRLFINPGDRIAVTTPTFFAALDTFSVYRPEFLEIPITRGHIDLDIANEVLSKKPKFLYLIPDHQNPCGLSISQEQRKSLLQMSKKYGVVVIEDAAYSNLAFNGIAEKPIAARDDSLTLGNVVYVNTFSKTIAPGLRVGWIAANDEIVEKLRAVKLATDVHTSAFNQMIVLEIATTKLSENIITSRELYSKKCDRMIDALSDCMPDECWWSEPAGGLFLWLELPGHIDTKQLFERAIKESSIAFVPGSLSAVGKDCDNAIRLSFATVDEARIDEGISRLSSLL